MEGKLHRIAVLSDTHGLLRPEVKEILKDCPVILHGGDINRQSILDELGQYGKVYVVRGNNDKEWAKGIPEELFFSLYGFQIYMVHNKKHAGPAANDADIVIYGHSHKYEEKYENGRFFLNPGSCGPRRFHQPVTLAVMEIGEEHTFKVTKIDLSPKAGFGQIPDISEKDMRKLITFILKDMKAGRSMDEIAAKNHVDRELAEQICRIYVTHPGVDVDGILNKMELRSLYH